MTCTNQARLSRFARKKIGQLQVADDPGVDLHVQQTILERQWRVGGRQIQRQRFYPDCPLLSSWLLLTREQGAFTTAPPDPYANCHAPLARFLASWSGSLWGDSS